MKKNVGVQDAHMRTLVAVVALLFAIFIENTTLRIILAVIAAILAGTAFLHTCPLYSLLGKDTSDTKPAEDVTPTETSVQEPNEPVQEVAEKTSETS